LRAGGPKSCSQRFAADSQNLQVMAGAKTALEGVGQKEGRALTGPGPLFLVSGYELCHELKDTFGEAIPVIFISGTRTEPGDRRLGAPKHRCTPPLDRQKPCKSAPSGDHSTLRTPRF
jgi:hypothetical protein